MYTFLSWLFRIFAIRYYWYYIDRYILKLKLPRHYAQVYLPYNLYFSATDVICLKDYKWSSDLLQSSSDYYQKLKSTVIQNVSKNLQFKNLKSLHVTCYFRQVYVYKKRHSQFIGYTMLKKGLFICFLALTTNFNILWYYILWYAKV